MKKKTKSIAKVIDKHETQLIANYPNDLIEFLGGKEQIEKINIYGHRIIFVMMEMLKAIQVHKISIQDAKDIIRDELIIENGRITSMKEIKEEELQKRRELESGKQLAIIEERYFAEDFTMLQMVLTTKALNDNGRIKVENNNVFRDQLAVLSHLGAHVVESNTGKEKLMANFIDSPIYDKGNNYIRFYISKTTSRMLLDNIGGYTKVYRKLIFNTRDKSQINIYLYLQKKFGKNNGGRIKIETFIQEMRLPDYCKETARLKTYLEKRSSELTKNGTVSFGFKIIDHYIDFVLFQTANTVGIEYPTDEEYRASNAIKNIKKKRKLNGHQMTYILAKFKEHGYTKMSIITNKKLSLKIIGDAYLLWFVEQCSFNGL